jgi:hypothetical protein
MARLKGCSLAWLLFLCIPAGVLGQPRLDLVGGNTFGFGDVYAGDKVTHQLTLRNTGTDTLIISDVSAGCGCTGTLMSSSHIPPAGSGILSISFNSARLAGPTQKVVTLNTNDTSHAHVRITFNANVIKSLTIVPEYLVFRTSVDSPSTEEVTITNTGSTPIRILSATSSLDRLSVKMSTDRIDPGKESLLTCLLAPGREGLVNGSITIVTDRPRASTLSVRFFGLVAGRNGRGARADHN